MTKFKTDAHIWGLISNWYVCFLFCGNQDYFVLRYSKLNIWPWIVKVKVITIINSGNLWVKAINPAENEKKNLKTGLEIMNKSQLPTAVVQNIKSPPISRLTLWHNSTFERFQPS